MHIELSIDKEQPLTYPLNKQKLILGSNVACDIVITQKNISRKHLVILKKNQKYFVVDQGSTNGSFVNDVRLVPGAEVEFTTFYPLRLGSKVLITLHADEEAVAPEENDDIEAPEETNSLKNFFKEEKEETTKMISLKDLNKASTAGLVKKKAEVVAKKVSPKEQKQKDQKKIKIIGAVSLAIFLGAAYYNKRMVEEAEAPLASTVVAPKKVNPALVAPNTPIKRAQDPDLLTNEIVLGLRNSPKCTQGLEKELCIALPSVNEGKWGVVQAEKALVIFTDGPGYKAKAQVYVKGRNDQKSYQTDLNLMMMILWVYENVPAEVPGNLKLFNDSIITVTFLNSTTAEGELLAAGVFVPESLLRLRALLSEEQFVKARKEGALTFSYAFDYLRFL